MNSASLAIEGVHAVVYTVALEWSMDRNSMNDCHIATLIVRSLARFVDFEEVGLDKVHIDDKQPLHHIESVRWSLSAFVVA